MSSFISIPDPCHESWQQMTPAAGGRHCAQCCKTVVDFSAWQQQEIADYLEQHRGEQVCGRFRNAQLEASIEDRVIMVSIQRSPLPLVKKVAAIILLCLGLMQEACVSDTSPNVGKAPRATTGVIITEVDTLKQSVGEEHLTGEVVKMKRPDTAAAGHSKKRHKKHAKQDVPEITVEDPRDYTMGGLPAPEFPEEVKPVPDTVK